MRAPSSGVNQRTAAPWRDPRPTEERKGRLTMNATIKHRYVVAAGGLMFAAASLVSAVTPVAAQTPPRTSCSVGGMGEQSPAIRMRRDVGVRTSPDFTGVTLEPGQT